MDDETGIWHVYLVRTGSGSLYTGVTTDVDRRIDEHRRSGARAARYLRGRGPLRVVYRAAVGDRGLALRVESRLKRWPRERKESLVASSPDAARLLADLGLERSPEDDD